MWNKALLYTKKNFCIVQVQLINTNRGANFNIIAKSKILKKPVAFALILDTLFKFNQ